MSRSRFDLSARLAWSVFYCFPYDPVLARGVRRASSILPEFRLRRFVYTSGSFHRRGVAFDRPRRTDVNPGPQREPNGSSSITSHVDIDPIASRPESYRVAHPIVLARRDRNLGVAPRPMSRVLLRPARHLLGDAHHEDARDASQLVPVAVRAFPRAKGKFAEIAQIAADTSLLHRLPRRGVLRGLVVLPAPFREDHPVAVLVRDHEHLDAGAVRARADREAPGDEPRARLAVALIFSSHA
eukprot:30999-Pelagococcus_subviridis.AAC.7